MLAPFLGRPAVQAILRPPAFLDSCRRGLGLWLPTAKGVKAGENLAHPGTVAAHGLGDAFQTVARIGSSIAGLQLAAGPLFGDEATL